MFSTSLVNCSQIMFAFPLDSKGFVKFIFAQYPWRIENIRFFHLIFSFSNIVTWLYIRLFFREHLENNLIFCYIFFQQLFRSQQTQAQTPNAAQLQLLQQQQQQYLAQQQQAAFPQPPYVLNPQQEQPYLITTGVPQYYGVGPWVYPAPASLIQQGANNGQRRPITPNGTTEAQQQVQVGYRVEYENDRIIRWKINSYHARKSQNKRKKTVLWFLQEIITFSNF